MGKPSKSYRKPRSESAFNNRLQFQEHKCQLTGSLKKAQQELKEIKMMLKKQEKREKMIREREAEKRKKQENNVNDEENWLAHFMDSLEICDYKGSMV
ncbi:hypothetical protein RclHR1_11780003 [Rhizophagus clarus]|uniref:Uncharacterized protein n=1 Tax=Rhizophagus clarus TaxID=94130 RepID=A0A2Z6QKE0_9GLOM|nr:hypothetical protein RclHR1_11780003 [Rhizophagus clarus]GES99770.1 hypothetical protein RCL_jg2734.t1 [Rhizophagus clarus]